MKTAGLVVVAFWVVSGVLASPLRAQEGETPPAETTPPATTPSGQDLGSYVESQLMEAEEAYPFVEHHGYFRFRSDNFWNLDLDTQGTSPILPPLEATAAAEESANLFDSGAEHLVTTNIRFRYHPIFHITDQARIHAEIDMLDNLVLGSTPDGFGFFGGSPQSRFDTPLVAFSPGAQPMNEELTFRDSIRVKQAYAEMEFLGLLRVGRMPSHWGLGILANSGGSYSSSPLMPRTSYRGTPIGGFNCTDCDFGDSVDRALFITRIFPTIYVGVAYDWPSQGTTGYFENQPLGQARDLAEIDDVFQMVFTAFRVYYTEQEQRERARLITELNEPVIEGGLYVVLRNQDAEQGNGAFLPNDTETVFAPRLADAVIPDLWVRLQYEPAFRQRIRLELEAVAVIGELENVNPLPPTENDPASPRDIEQIGIAFESDFRFENLTTGLNGGYASGRSTEGDNARLRPGWGVIDDNPVTAGNQSDERVTNFKFDRDYFVDMIMFREIIGAITNAIYINPYLQYNFFTAQTSAMGARIDGIYALAPQPDVTPGGEGSIGLELDATVFYHTDSYQADVSYGIFFPFGAFDGQPGRARIPNVTNVLQLDPTYEETVEASIAHTLQFRLIWAF